MSKNFNEPHRSKNRLKKTNRILINRSNDQKNVDDLDNLTKEQWRGIQEAMKEIDSGKDVPHEVVIAEMRSKYFNA